MIEAVELGAKKAVLARAMKISRTTLNQNIKIKEHFGITGLIQGYKLSDSTNKREQRELHSASRISGNRTEQIKDIEAKGSQENNGKCLCTCVPFLEFGKGSVFFMRCNT